jgi:hypothetical protein
MSYLYEEIERIVRCSGEPYEQTTRGIRTRCLVHHDTNPSCDIDRGNDNVTAVACCRSWSCNSGEILAAWMRRGGGSRDDRQRSASPPRKQRSPRVHATRAKAASAALWGIEQEKRLAIAGAKWGIASEFEYFDANRKLVEVVIRFEPCDAAGRRACDSRGKPAKELRSISPRRTGWICKQSPNPRPLYGLLDLLDHPGHDVVIVEGEAKRDALAAVLSMAGSRFVVVSPPGGASRLHAADLAPLAERRVVLWPDAHETGIGAMREVESAIAKGPR